MQARRHHEEFTKLSPLELERRGPGHATGRIDMGDDRDRRRLAYDQDSVHRSPHYSRNSSPHIRRGSRERSNPHWDSGDMRVGRRHPGHVPISHGDLRKRPHPPPRTQHVEDTEFYEHSRVSDVDGGRRAKHLHGYDHATHDDVNNERGLSTGRVAPLREKLMPVEDTEFYEPSRVSDVDGGRRVKHVHSYDHATHSDMNNERGLSAGRVAPLREKLMPVEEGEIAEPYCELCAAGGHSGSPSHEMDMPHGKDDRIRYPNHLDRSSHAEAYEDEERKVYAREGSLAAHYTTGAREVWEHSAHNNGSRGHLGNNLNLKRKYMDPFGDPEIYSSPDEHIYSTRSSELATASAYPKGLHVDARRNHAKATNHLIHPPLYRHEQHCTHGDDLEELRYIKQQKFAHEGHYPHGYPSRIFDEVNHPYVQVPCNCCQMDDRIGDVSSLHCRHAATDGVNDMKDFINSSENAAWKHTSLRKLSAPCRYEESDTPDEDGKFIVSSYGHANYYESRPPHNRKAVNLGLRNDHISRSRSDHSFGRDGESRILERSYHRDETSRYDRRVGGIAARLQRVEEEDGMDMSSNQEMHDGQYRFEEFLGDNHEDMITRKWKRVGYEDLEDEEGLLDGENMNDLYGSGSHANETGMAKTSYHREANQRRFASDGRLSIKNRLEYLPEHSVRYGQYRGKGINMNFKSGRMKVYKPDHHRGHEHGFYNKNQNFGKRNDDYFEANEYDPSEEQEILEDPELSEESDEFKQLVNAAFLKYSKRITINSVVQQRYRARGKAGSLFCIVCGRRFSKEFLSTENLVKHAFMARRAQHRANHLGLQRAICVLLGWDTYISEDMPTAPPRVLPEDEALALKEDLIIWPPVIIIHNISILIDRPEDQKVLSIETVQAFLREKGYVEGKMVVCHGKPTDRSSMVVKFLGTFSGFGNALKLHQFFAEHNHGRAEFQKMTSGGRAKRGSKSSMAVTGENCTERMLYGYMGIAEDLDNVDFRTKKICEIKSKKEIQDFANDPVPSKTNDV